ncbi:trypsin-like peptidase domain-containing protein [Streptomyces sp. NPDC020742]|uniref:S1C family serine protease n=1 Tax=Streptomyces sp. NPDC020742 TaxID=3154897 RepID=UPI0033D8DA70
MDDGKAAGPKLKWWSRPGRTPGTGPSADAGPPMAPPADGPADGAPTGASGPAGGPVADESGDWIVRPPEPRTPAAPPAQPTGKDAPAGAVDEARPVGAERELAAAAPGGPSLEKAPAADGAPETAGAARSGAATVTLGQISADLGDEAPPAAAAPAGAAEPAGAAPQPQDAVASGPAGPAAPARPLHPEDPYGTPPYGGPGPWAPAPPVQRPEPRPGSTLGWSGATPAQGTPAQGTPVPPAAGPMPPYGPEPAAAQAAAGAVAPLAPSEAVPQPAPGGADTAFMPRPGDGGPRPAAAPPASAPPGSGPAGPGAWQQYDPWSAPLQGGPPAVPHGGRRIRRGQLVAGAVALALLAGGVGGGVGAYVERYGGINDINLPQEAGDGSGRRPDSVAGIARAALPGVVTLHVRGNTEQGTGTGFVLDRQGHILTNNHVVEPAGTGGEISVTFSGGQTAKAKVVGQDGGYDLAVVQVEGVTGLRPLPLGNSDSVQVGDPVVAIGAPFDLANTVTSGIISAKQRPITAGGAKGDGSDVSYVDALQTDAPINPGNSGGPLVDARARVIGINSAIRAADSAGGSDSGGQGGSIGLGFAIPINQAKRVAEELINTGKATHPVIGVTLEMEYAGDGARVSAHGKAGRQPVSPDGPAARAGIRAGDVITQVDGAAVHSGEELIVKVRSHRPGDTLLLTVHRGGKERSVRLKLGSSTAD